MSKRIMADHQPAADTAAVATLANGVNYDIELESVVWSYDTTPTGGALTIASGATTIAKVDIPTSGPGFLPLKGFGTLVKGDAITATLAAGGGSVVGKVALAGRYL